MQGDRRENAGRVQGDRGRPKGECKNSAKECFELLCTNFGAFWDCFGVGLSKLGALWGRSRYVKVTFVYFGLTLVTWWSHFGHIQVVYQKIYIFSMDFNDFIKHSAYVNISLGLLWGQILVTLRIEGKFGSVLAHLLLTFGALWLHFKHLDFDLL